MRAALLALFAVSCGAARWPHVLDPADIVELSEGKPRIRRLRDLGGVHLGRPGPLHPEPDGAFTVGELILIEGSGFGRQPTVEIGGRPAEVLWRTAGGGIIVRIPAGVGVGPQPVAVSTATARAETLVPLRRLAVVLDVHQGVLHTVAVAGGSALPPQLGTVGQPRRLPGARHLVLAPTGAAAYVVQTAAAGDQVAIVDLASPEASRAAEVRPLAHRVQAVAAAAQAPVVAFVGDDQVTLWQVQSPRRPLPWNAAPLPEPARGAQAAALDPTGRLLALLLPEGNRVALCQVQPTERGVQPVLVAQAEVLPGARQRLLADLAFAPDGQSVWVLSGDVPAGRSAGHQPTRLSLLRLGTSDREAGRMQGELSLVRTVELAEAGAPVQLRLARPPPAAGTTIRSAPEGAVAFVTTVAPEALAGAAGGGTLLRADSSGQTTVLYAGEELPGGLDLTPDGGVAVVGLVRPGSQGLAVLAAHTEMVSTLSIPLGAAAEAHRRPPFPSLRVAVQP
ncbi:MAG: hypothetical protein RMK29_19825 [Myxococcales bacterium]|nr:hypothetical protein [Myxococcota bacterium]MDW8283958.1 hypothetical protein [Myxococcales bacterium]